MSYQPSVLEQLQLNVGAIIQADPFFADVVVNIWRPRAALSAMMIQNKIDQALTGIAGKGVTAVVLMPFIEVPYPDAPGPDLRVIVKVQFIENPLINMGATGTQVSVEDYTLMLLAIDQQRFFQNIGAAMTVDREAAVPIGSYEAKNYTAYELKFNIRMGIAGPYRTPMPVISGDASGVVITGAAGATIWYTTDGSYPWSGNPSAKVYGAQALTDEAGGAPVTDESSGTILTDEGGPFPVTTPAQVLAVAYAPNQQASNLAAKTFS